MKLTRLCLEINLDCCDGLRDGEILLEGDALGDKDEDRLGLALIETLGDFDGLRLGESEGLYA